MERSFHDAAMRETVTTLVRAIEPYDEQEQAHIDAVGAWLASGAPFTRTQPPDVPPQHLVAYVALVDPATQHLLLVDHRKASLWLPGGGHVEPGEHPRATAARECGEEFGIEPVFLFEEPLFLTVTRTVGSTAGHTDVSLWYVMHTSIDAPLTYDQGEFAAVRWFAFDAIPSERSDPHMRRFVQKLEARLQADAPSAITSP